MTPCRPPFSITPEFITLVAGISLALGKLSVVQRGGGRSGSDVLTVSGPYSHTWTLRKASQRRRKRTKDGRHVSALRKSGSGK